MSGLVFPVGFYRAWQLNTGQIAIYDFATKQPGWDAWANVPVAQRLQELCGLTLLVENDATAAGDR